MAAASMGHPDMVELLLQRGATTEQANNIGDTVLMLVARSEAPEMVKLLLSKGAKVNAKGNRGRTPLFYAAYNGALENIKLLLAAGADPNAAAPDSDDLDAPVYDAATVAQRQNHPLAEALIREAQSKASGSKR
jgi:ankyrin repeat protein